MLKKIWRDNLSRVHSILWLLIMEICKIMLKIASYSLVTNLFCIAKEKELIIMESPKKIKQLNQKRKKIRNSLRKKKENRSRRRLKKKINIPKKALMMILIQNPKKMEEVNRKKTKQMVMMQEQLKRSKISLIQIHQNMLSICHHLRIFCRQQTLTRRYMANSHIQSQ